MTDANQPRPYRPSNGTEGEIFMGAWCANCAHDSDDTEFGCMVQLRALAYSITDPEYPCEWQYNANGNPQCTAFTRAGSDGEGATPRCDQTPDLFGA